MTPSERARLLRMIRDEHGLAKFELRVASKLALRLFVDDGSPQ